MAREGRTMDMGKLGREKGVRRNTTDIRNDIDQKREKGPKYPKMESKSTKSEAEKAFFKENPDTLLWLTGWLEKIQDGRGINVRSADRRRLSEVLESELLVGDIGDEVRAFLKSDQRGADSFVGKDYFSKKFDADSNHYNLASIRDSIGGSRREAADLVAFVSLLGNKYDLEAVLKGESDTRKDASHLQLSGITTEEAKNLVKVFKSAEHIDKMLEILFERTGKVLQKEMDSKKLLRFVGEISTSCQNFNTQLLQKYFATEQRKIECKQCVQEEAVKGDVYWIMDSIKAYEIIFGNLTEQEFEKLMPESLWKGVPDYQKSGVERYYLDRFPDSKIVKEITAAKEDKDRAWRVQWDKDLAKHKAKRVDSGTGRTVQVVKEERLLELKKEGERSKEPSEQVFAYTNPDAPTTALAKAQETGLVRIAPEDKKADEIFVPLDRSEGQYLKEIDAGIGEMKAETEMGKRVKIFLEKVWPQFLVARADGADMKNIQTQAREATGMLDAEVRRDFEELIALTDDVEKNQPKIEVVVQRLRNSDVLHNYNVYVRAEVLNRTRKTITGEEQVSLLSSIAFEVKEKMMIEISGEPAKILLLGDRVDEIDREAPGMGFVVRGERQAVVFHEASLNQARAWYAYLRTDAPLVVPEGKVPHSINGVIQQALRKEFGTNPPEDRVEIMAMTISRSTAVHEAQHLRDMGEGWPKQERGEVVEQRVLEETNAYLASMADAGSAKGFNAPLADLVSTIQLYISYETNPMQVLSDWGRVYQKTADRVLRGLSEKLGAGKVSDKEMKTKYLDVCERVLRAALVKGQAELRKVAQELLDEHRAAHEADKIKSDIKVVKREESSSSARPKKAAAQIGGRPLDPFGSADLKQIKHGMEKVLAAMVLTATLGVGSDRGSEDRAAVAEPASVPTVEIKNEKSGNENIDWEQIEMDNANQSASMEMTRRMDEIKAFGRGVWGYAEQRLADFGVTKTNNKNFDQAVAKLSQICLRAIAQGDFGLKDVDSQSVKEWEAKISTRTAEKIRDFLDGEILDSEIKGAFGAN